MFPLPRIHSKKAQTGFDVLPLIIIFIIVAGIIMAIMGGVVDELRDQELRSGSNVSTKYNVTTRLGGAISDFAGNFGTFFSLGILVVILGIVGIFLFLGRRGPQQ